MCSEKKECYVAWILSSHDQYEAAHGQLEDTYDCCYFDENITYTVGRAGHHNVVMASPVSSTDTPTIEIIVNDLLLHYPSVRAGFVLSTDAYIPRGRLLRVGDVVLGGNFPDTAHGVVYVDAEKTNNEGRLFMTGQSGNVPAAISAAVERHKSNNSFRRSGEYVQAWYGIIASSTQQIKDSLVEKTINEKVCLCFETAASTMRSRPLCLLAGITNYCGENKEVSAREQACKAVVSYLARLMQHMDQRELQTERSITEYLQYEALDLEKPACRLLRLEGGFGELQCHTFQAYLPSDEQTSDDKIHDETLLIPYEALSYCWGSNELTDAVRVNGKILMITSNLFLALRFLRHVDRDRILWIDAICIDQSNTLERTQQVAMMRRLYSHADEVLIWLGNIGDANGSLISTLRTFEAEVPRKARRQWTSEDIRHRQLWDQVHKSSVKDESSLQSRLEHMMNNPWFSRVWIIQEMANAKRASLGCTNGWIDASTFAVAPKLLRIEPSTQCQAIIDIMPGASRMFSWYSQEPNLSTLLWRFRESQASDPRDKLYALLGLSSDRPIAADYSKTEQAIVKDIVEYLFEGYDSWSVNMSRSSIMEIPILFSRGLENLMLRGVILDDLRQFPTRQMTPLLLTKETVDYLRFIQSPVLKQLEHQDVLVLSSNYTKQLASLLASGDKIQVSNGILAASRRKGVGFISAVLDRDGDDIELSRDIVTEAISHGPSVLTRFLEKYENKARSIKDVDDKNEKELLKDFQRLKDSFEHAGIFPKHSDPLRRLLIQRTSKKLGDLRFRRRLMEFVETITEADLQNTDTTLQAFLQQTYDQTKLTDEVSVTTIRGGQDGIQKFLGLDVLTFDNAMADLWSKFCRA